MEASRFLDARSAARKSSSLLLPRPAAAASSSCALVDGVTCRPMHTHSCLQPQIFVHAPNVMLLQKILSSASKRVPN